jgi:hypothetical protein
MLSNEIDKIINEHCAKEINKCIKSKVKIPKETLENFIKSLTYMIKSNTSIGPECTALWQTLYAFYHYSNGINSMSKKIQHEFDLGAVHGCIKMLEMCKEIEKDHVKDFED